MAVIITPVGTSLFNNGSEHNRALGRYFATLQHYRQSSWEDYSGYIEPLRDLTERFVDSGADPSVSSAELQSSTKIQARLGEDIQVRLIATDTVTSRLAAEILKNKASVLGSSVSVEFDYPDDVIRGLQAQDNEEFANSGVPNLWKRLTSISAGIRNGQSFAINITGGYGATSPILTVFARLNRVPLYYYFEDAAEVIEIQNILTKAHLVPP